MDKLRQGLAEATQRLRLEQGLSQEKLAARAGIHRSYVFKLEKGEVNPSLEVISGIAGALGVSASKLIELAERGGPE